VIIAKRLTCLADFKFSEIEKAYDIFGRAAETKALKVNIEFD
jgi:alcohol dehydrogenase